MKDLWDSVLKRLSGELSETTINTWFDEVTVVTMEDSAFVLHCSNTFKKNTIEARFLPHIKAALKDLFSTDLEVKILDDDQLAAYHGVAPDRPGDLSESQAFTFETYVVGPQNKLAFAAAKAVTEKPGENYNPLFIYGDSGLGKTHLLYAIANALRKKRPDARIVYVKGDDFTNELIASIRENRNAEFREKYRQTDILLMDDIQFIAGKIQTQEEFFHTFNTLYESGRQIVLTSDRPPKEITQLEDRLRTRFEWGLMVDVAPPDFETRFAIIQNKAAMLGVKLPGDVMDYIAENITSNVRQIEGTLNKILAYRDLLDDQVNEETVGREPLEHIDGGAFKFVAPGSALNEVEKICADTEDMVTVTQGKRHLMFEAGSTQLICRRLEGEFLDYRNAIPTNNPICLEVDNKTMIESLERVSVVISEKLKSPVRCLFSADKVYMSARTGNGEARDICPVRGDGQELEIGFNNRYLMDALRYAPADTVKMHLNTGISPCIITPVDDSDNFIYMVLPVRLKAQ